MAYSANQLPNGLEEKATPLDADVVVVGDSADSNRAKKTTWTQVKAFLKTYFDTLYAGVLGADDNYVTDAEKVVIGNTSGTNTGDESTATDTAEGVVELATDAEMTTGTATNRAVTPANAKVELDKKLALAGGTLTGAVIANDHGTATTDEVVNVCYGTSATPPTASTTTEGALYIQYTA